MNSLEVALQANASAYRRAVQTGAPGECWDLLVLTAANEKQAQGYRQELALQERPVGTAGAFFPAVQRTLVVPDPPSRRAGSGGATLAALRALTETFGLSPGDLGRLRILLIHSGGASQRLPAYSSLGKIFAPLSLLRPDGRIATLFDHLYITLAGLPERLGPGMLVVAGDVFLLFDHRHVARPPSGINAISMRVDAELGRGHGVFATDSRARVTRTLQKVSVEAMRDAGAADAAGRVLIDTGLLFFDAPRTRLLAELAGCSRQGRKPRTGLHERSAVPIDLYEDITGALARATRREEFLRPPRLATMRRALWAALRGTPFTVSQVDGEFLHLGTTRQFRDAMVGRNPSPAAELFQRNVLAHGDWDLPAGVRVYHSVLRAAGSRGGVLGHGSVVEHSILRAGSRIADGSVCSQVVAETTPIDLGPELLLFQTPLRDGRSKRWFAQVVCGVEDDFKGIYAQGNCVYMNQPMDRWLKRCGIKPQELWSGVAPPRRTLWTARLFIATPKRDAAELALRLTRPAVKRSDVSRWRKSARYSMEQILEQADPAALIEHRERVSAAIQVGEMIESIRSNEDRPMESVIGRYTTAAAYHEAERLLEEFAETPPLENPQTALAQARARWCVVQLLQRPDHPHPAAARARIEPAMQRAFAKVAQASEIVRCRITVRSRPDPKLPRGIQIVAEAPVRLDLAGGWSDTPPYCFECGGHVVNVAIDLDGHAPVRAVVRTLNRPELFLESHDLGKTVRLTRTPGGGADVSDPFALHKVALATAGLLPTTHSDVGRHLRMLGAGLHVATESRVPKGSGLGTSSILAAVLLAALHRLRGTTPGPQTLIEQTLLLEQRLGTGGGWQDQVGGIVGGVKSTTTSPGVPQRPRIEPLPLSEELYDALEERLVVYYSGQQRLARDILRRVMGRWLAREPAMRLLTNSLKQQAAALREALPVEDWPRAADAISHYWQTKKELYPGSTTPAIDLLLLDTKQDYIAACLAGAGGGGFAYFLCEDATQARRLRSRLTDYAAQPGFMGGVYATRINRAGLRVRLSRTS